MKTGLEIQYFNLIIHMHRNIVCQRQNYTVKDNTVTWETLLENPEGKGLKKQSIQLKSQNRIQREALPPINISPITGKKKTLEDLPTSNGLIYGQLESLERDEKWRKKDQREKYLKK